MGGVPYIVKQPLNFRTSGQHATSRLFNYTLLPSLALFALTAHAEPLAYGAFESDTVSDVGRAFLPYAVHGTGGDLAQITDLRYCGASGATGKFVVAIRLPGLKISGPPLPKDACKSNLKDLAKVYDGDQTFLSVATLLAVWSDWKLALTISDIETRQGVSPQDKQTLGSFNIPVDTASLELKGDYIAPQKISIALEFKPTGLIFAAEEALIQDYTIAPEQVARATSFLSAIDSFNIDVSHGWLEKNFSGVNKFPAADFDFSGRHFGIADVKYTYQPTMLTTAGSLIESSSGTSLPFSASWANPNLGFKALTIDPSPLMQDCSLEADFNKILCEAGNSAKRSLTKSVADILSSSWANQNLKPLSAARPLYWHIGKSAFKIRAGLQTVMSDPSYLIVKGTVAWESGNQ